MDMTTKSENSDEIRAIFTAACRRYRSQSGTTVARLETVDLVVPCWHGPLGSALENHVSIHGLHHVILEIDGIKFLVPEREVERFVEAVNAAQPAAKIEKLEKLNL